MRCLSKGLSVFLVGQALLSGICEGLDASDIVAELKADELIDRHISLCEEIDRERYYYHNTQASVDLERDVCADSCSPPRFIPTYAHPKNDRMCIFAHYDENSLTCTKFIRESSADAAAGHLQRNQGCGDKKNGTLIVRKYYHFLIDEGYNPPAMQEIGKLGPLIIGAIDRRVEVGGTANQDKEDNYSLLSPLLFRSRVAAPAEEFTTAVQDLPSCQGGACRSKQDQINIDLIETFIAEISLKFYSRFHVFEYGAPDVELLRVFDASKSNNRNNGTGILWSEFYRIGLKQLIDDTMTSEQGQVECKVNEDTCGGDDKQLKLKATSGALRYQIPRELHIETCTINDTSGRTRSYTIRLGARGPDSGLRRSIPFLFNDEIGIWNVKENGKDQRLATDIDPRISNGNEVEQKTCELMVARSKINGGAPLDDIHAALCDYRLGSFVWGDIVANLTRKIDNATCKFPNSIDFTDDDLLGPAHDVKYACLYNQPPSLVWPIFFSVFGALVLITLACVIKKKILCSYEKEGESNTNVHSVGDSIATDTKQNVKTVASSNPQFGL